MNLRIPFDILHIFVVPEKATSKIAMVDPPNTKRKNGESKNLVASLYTYSQPLIIVWFMMWV